MVISKKRDKKGHFKVFKEKKLKNSIILSNSPKFRIDRPNTERDLDSIYKGENPVLGPCGDASQAARGGDNFVYEHNYCQVVPNLQVEHEETIETSFGDSDCDDTYVDVEWRDGRRVVELSVLADALQACDHCHHPLHLHDCCGEKRFGLGGYLRVLCHHCGTIKTVKYGKQHRSSNINVSTKGNMIWDVNTKVAVGRSTVLSLSLSLSLSL